ncbi:carbon-nitrogen hydrolase family protein, partial [candidate division WOR-3 bacterium]|nr:carbon-nitrogen hydrolase family protein [candidate division WOR-3 bacterium]MBD3364823.1 carbon-nitrogen hydrolase family protein [candidate division WOR-3 bacterium]
MKAALVSNMITDDFEVNQKRILELAGNAAGSGVRRIVFPEAAATGLVNTGNPEHDLEIAEPVPGPRNSQWRDFARRKGVYFAAGFLERDGNKLYDSALLFDPGGNLVLQYRRIDTGWLNPGDNNTTYRTGKEIPYTDTEFGRVGFLILRPSGAGHGVCVEI